MRFALTGLQKYGINTSINRWARLIADIDKNLYKYLARMKRQWDAWPGQSGSRHSFLQDWPGGA